MAQLESRHSGSLESGTGGRDREGGLRLRRGATKRRPGSTYFSVANGNRTYLDHSMISSPSLRAATVPVGDPDTSNDEGNFSLGVYSHRWINYMGSKPILVLITITIIIPAHHRFFIIASDGGYDHIAPSAFFSSSSLLSSKVKRSEDLKSARVKEIVVEEDREVVEDVEAREERSVEDDSSLALCPSVDASPGQCMRYSSSASLKTDDLDAVQACQHVHSIDTSANPTPSGRPGGLSFSGRQCHQEVQPEWPDGPVPPQAHQVNYNMLIPHFVHEYS
ncbi:hypothetical protein BDN72DRAFT_865848 [Pluteus cervinus]|uniref:Uncharacterized protein n=1 Tax=Pluteus cervinus TaxID=181527 RepID=A0ACD2ZZ24_9AGAR|nr:hypothetical protein BDN72DRAFT_865848 [Pluteus cervinus]